MAWGKEEFRAKYKESNECFKKIKDNYYDLDYEYQMLAKELQQKENIIKEVREYVNNYFILGAGSEYLRKLNEILDKENK